ncbi:DUF5914 domain-containing protein, partial [Mycobacterium sp. NAZ190054]|uniref:DUF5914 domain-containing protein n=1 Tax=Mycobacterium sp. NAZ190054 TaxID=1747766 RepID=UPI000B16DA46
SSSENPSEDLLECHFGGKLSERQRELHDLAHHRRELPRQRPGAWFHPYSFARLRVLSAPPADDGLTADLDRFVVEVTFHIGRLGVPVIAEFTTPGPRTVVMRIVEGEGRGSVVETHATPLGPGPDGRPRSAVIEAVIAHSDRPRFGAGLVAAPLLRPLMRRAANRLWRDDLAYAERLFELRSQPRP